MKRNISTYFLMILICFQIISAVPSGLLLIIDPTGNKLGTPLSMLDGSPFTNFLIPGLFLFTMLGIFPILVLYGLTKRSIFKAADKLNPYKLQHWSWTFSYYLGLLLVLWINMQLLFLKSWAMLHFMYSMLGVLIIIVTHLPSVKQNYEIKSNH
ncbi:MAG: hypothetical protein HKN87_01050 [Saprospiraceae bacterium]|nr:hypothetical protein [Saprospiraceae bacterium]